MFTSRAFQLEVNMHRNHVHISFILDRSGSMYDIRREAIGGFNGFVASQRSLPGTADLSLILFDHEYSLVLENVDIQRVPDLDGVTYQPRGTTALLDAIGQTVDELGARLAAMPENRRPEKVIVAILTDGFENASQRYTATQVSEMIRLQRETYSWDFIFLGANQDAFLTAQGLSIDSADAVSYDATPAGITNAYASLNEMITYRRSPSNAPVN